jgi:Mg-chelatase subunit ChlD
MTKKTQKKAEKKGAATTGTSDGAGADIWFLLDRSGSMASIERDVVRGFDRFFDEQRKQAGDATVTIVQFDDTEPHDILVDAKPLAKVRSIAERFEPRGMTPLYDAIGQLLDRAERGNGDPADQLVVILTDGMENASHIWTQKKLFERIGALRAAGWTFVFLGANQDSYEAGAGLSMADGNVSNFRPDAAGTAAAYAGLSRTVSEWRGKPREDRRRDVDDFWAGQKEAEEV